MKNLSKYIFEKLKIPKNVKPFDETISGSTEKLLEIIAYNLLFRDRTEKTALTELTEDWLKDNKVEKIRIYADKENEEIKDYYENKDIWDLITNNVEKIKYVEESKFKLGLKYCGECGAFIVYINNEMMMIGLKKNADKNDISEIIIVEKINK